jgi:hypothetical protein
MIKCCDWRIVKQKGVTSVWVIEIYADNSHRRWCYQQDVRVPISYEDVECAHDNEYFEGGNPSLRSVKWEYL